MKYLMEMFNFSQNAIGINECIFALYYSALTYWDPDKMVTIFQTIFSDVFSRINMSEFRLEFHWSLFLKWWRHQMETPSALLALCSGNSPVTAQLWRFLVHLRLNNPLSKQSKRRVNALRCPCPQGIKIEADWSAMISRQPFWLICHRKCMD